MKHLFSSKDREVDMEDIPVLIRELQKFHDKAKEAGATSTTASFSHYSSPCGTINRTEMTLLAHKGK